MNEIKHHTILLIDDDEDDQYIFAEALKEISPAINCLSARTGIEGFDVLQENSFPSIIFLDINMPMMNGFEFLLLIKETEVLKKIPVVILSTSKNPADMKRATGLGAVQFLTKTADFKILKEKIQSVLLSDYSRENQS